MTFEGDVTLYGSTTSPFVRKVRVCLMEKQIPHRFEITPPWSAAGGVDRLNPLHKVPVLRLQDKTLLHDSRVIVQYLEARDGSRPLLPADAAARIEALKLESVADGISDAVALYTQESWRQPHARSDYWLKRQRQKIEEGAKALEIATAGRAPVAELIQLEHIAIGAALCFVSFWLPELEWRDESPRLCNLCGSLEEFDSWIQTRPHLAPGASFPKL